MLQFRESDGGRWQAGYRGIEGDCVVRAICNVTGRPYGQTYQECARLNRRGVLGGLVVPECPDDHTATCRNGVFVDNPLFRQYMNQIGFCYARMAKPIAWSRCPWIKRGQWILRVSDDQGDIGHATAIMDGVIVDAADPRDAAQWDGVAMPWMHGAWEYMPPTL